MRKLLLSLLMLIVCISSTMAAAKADASQAEFAKALGDMRVQGIKNASNKALSKVIPVKANLKVDNPVKVSLDLKKGATYAIYCSGVNVPKSKELFMFNNATFMINGRKRPFTPASYIGSDNVHYQKILKRTPLKYGGKTMPKAIQLGCGSSMFIKSVVDQKLEFDLLYQGAANSEATITVITLIGGNQINSFAAKYPAQSDTYAAYTTSNILSAISAPTLALEKNMVEQMLSKITKKDALRAELNAIASIKGEDKQTAAYINLFYKVRKIAALQDRLQWLKAEPIQLAFDAMKKKKGYDTATNQTRLNELKAMIKAGFADLYSGKDEAIAKAEKALELQKLILLDNKSINFDEIIVGRYTLGNKVKTSTAADLGTPDNNWSNQTSSSQKGFDAEVGAFNIRSASEYRTIYKPQWDSSLPDLRLHYDAEKLLFSMVPKGDHHWQVFEYNMKGKKLNQVTNGSEEDIDYFDAAYLPSEKLAVVSNVGGQGVPCVNGRDQVGNLCLFDPKTKDMRRLTFDQDANWGPSMMHNGKVMYTRWEYTDLIHFFSRFVMSMNPDGTEQKALFGSGMMFPTSTFDIQSLPEHPSRFVAIVSGHHGTIRSGRLFLFDPAISRTSTDGIVHELPYRNRVLDPIIKDQLVDGVWPQFLKPQAVDNETFIVTAKLKEGGLWGIYLVDTYDNLVLLAEYEGDGLMNPALLRTTKRPPVIPDKTDQSKKHATVFIQDIYEGVGMQGVPRGTVKQLRLHTYEYAYLKSPSNHNAQGIQAGWDIKTCLGIVNVEEDGSALFNIPANTPVSIQPLDSEGRAIQWMRSWFTGMPGEVVSCVGCHEDLNQIPIPKRTIASTIEPRELTAPVGGVAPLTFETHVQPVLDRKCVSCHSEGKKIDFTPGRKDKGGYSMSYLSLHPYAHRQGPESPMAVLIPYEYHANNSRLIQMLENGHYGVELTKEEWYAFTNWIDYNVPDKGSFTINNGIFPDQYNKRVRLANKYANGISYSWVEQTQNFKKYLESQPKTVVKPDFKEPKFKEVTVKGFPFQATKGETMTLNVKGQKITFVKIPAGSFVMGENKKNSNAAPAHKAVVEKAFWMSETELSNEQVRAVMPEHSSRFYDQQWRDHINEGYAANGDKQVAIRLRYTQAEEIAKRIAKITGKNVTLPTETQWEWAARGGSDKPYWFSTSDKYGDFSKSENLSDKQMLKMAVTGRERPLTKGTYDYERGIFIPKDDKIDDGNMLPADPSKRSYKANPFGLYDMLGNVSEWTRSDYALYSEKQAKADTKVVKGGNWKTHPKDASVASRKWYYTWQAPFNVGVRLIIEE